MGTGIYFQRFDSSGARGGNGTSVYCGGSAPALAVAPDGRFVIVWQSGDGDGQGVFAQRYNADGAAMGGPLWISQGAAGDQTAPSVAMDDNGDFMVMFLSGGNTVSRWIAWNAPSDPLPYGPWIRTCSASGAVPGPLTSIEVTFDRPTNPTTFTPADVSLLDPVGRTIAATSVTTSDNQSFVIRFYDAQLPATHDQLQLAGVYKLTVGPDIADTAGLKMDQNGNGVCGEAEDDFDDQFTIQPTQVARPLFVEDFEGGSVNALPGCWSFAANSAKNSITVAQQSGTPHGTHVLEMDIDYRSTSGVETATLALDLTGASNVLLDFWAMPNNVYTSYNTGSVLISQDGSTWVTIASCTPGAWNYYSIDLDAAVNKYHMTYGPNFYVRFQHSADLGYYSDYYVFSVDDIRIATAPAVLSHTPSDEVPAGQSAIRLTFADPMDTTSFSVADDVDAFTGPSGNLLDPNHWMELDRHPHPGSEVQQPDGRGHVQHGARPQYPQPRGKALGPRRRRHCRRESRRPLPRLVHH